MHIIQDDEYCMTMRKGKVILISDALENKIWKRTGKFVKKSDAKYAIIINIYHCKKYLNSFRHSLTNSNRK